MNLYLLRTLFPTILILTLLTSCKKHTYTPEPATPNHPVISPSGKYALYINDLYDNTTASPTRYQRFFIYEQSNKSNPQKLVFESKQKFELRKDLLILWDDTQERVWAYTRDSTCLWTAQTSTQWVQRTYKPHQGLTVPKLLQQLRPEDFK